MPWIDSCVLLTGNCNWDDIDEGERSRVFYIDDFCRVIVDRRQRYQKFRTPPWIDRSNPLTAVDSHWRQRLSSFFAVRTGNFRPQERNFAGYRVTSDEVYAHPSKIYREYDCVEVNNERSAGLLRAWDFSNPALPVKFASKEFRTEIARRERSVLSYLLDRNPEIEQITLRPKAADPELGIRYWEIFERRKQLKRLAEFVISELRDQASETKIDLLRILLSRAASLHGMRAAHLDLGGHSVWVELRATVRLSHFMATHYGENRSLGEDRYHFLAHNVVYPEDILGGEHDHFRRSGCSSGRCEPRPETTPQLACRVLALRGLVLIAIRELRKRRLHCRVGLRVAGTRDQPTQLYPMQQPVGAPIKGRSALS